MPGWLESRETKKGPCFYARWWEDGKKHKRRIGTVNRRDAERVLQVIGRDLQLAPFGLGAREQITLKSFIEDRWLPKRSVRPNTLKRDTGLIRTHIVPALGHLDLTRITVEAVDDFTAKVKRGVSAHSAKRALAVLRRALNDARRYRLVTENVAAQSDVETPRRPLRTISLDDICRAIAAVPAAHRHVAFFAACTGLRWGEQAALLGSDLDLEIGVVKVTKQVPANLVGQVSEPKSLAGNRIVDLIPPVRDLLTTWPSPVGLLFTGERSHSYLNYRWFQINVWKKAAPSIRWHDLRHFFASLLIALGHDYLYVARQLGHSSPTVTLDVYSHLFEEQKRGKKLEATNVFNKLRAALRGVAVEVAA